MSIDTIYKLTQIIAEVETTAEINEGLADENRKLGAVSLKLAVGQLRAARTSMLKAARSIGIIGEDD